MLRVHLCMRRKCYTTDGVDSPCTCIEAACLFTHTHTHTHSVLAKVTPRPPIVPANHGGSTSAREHTVFHKHDTPGVLYHAAYMEGSYTEKIP